MTPAELHELERLAEQGDIKAQKALGEMYYNICKMGEAIKWYQMAAERGDVYAQYSIGHIYWQDTESGGYDDDETAAIWFRKAADQGNADSQFLLALCLMKSRSAEERAEAIKYCELAAMQGHEKAMNSLPGLRMTSNSSGSSCIIATACIGEAAPEVARLRTLRDEAISSDPIARDFFHVFWSRYYEWSPGVARLAAEDRQIAEHIRWAFLDPWLTWLELAAIAGRGGPGGLSDAERHQIADLVCRRASKWIAELPVLMEAKVPKDRESLFASFEKFRAAARAAFEDPSRGTT